MPELPDLLYIVRSLNDVLPGRAIRRVTVKRPVLVRNAIDLPLEQTLFGKSVQSISVHGPFLTFGLSGDIEIIINLMLAGRLQYQRAGEKAEGYLCLSFGLDDGASLNVCDEQQMAKVYIVRKGSYDSVPKYSSQGVDVLSPEFTIERFRDLAAANGRRQVRVFINDHTVLSAIGNAYADEILFEARIHPKTFVGRLSSDEVDRLYAAIKTVLAWGKEEVERSGQPIHVKVRGHMKVRNRKGEPCPRCGTTIRREGVRGHDVFFCPKCQQPTRQLFIDWSNAPHSSA
ncbi:MAG: DNA-formamidopyrimidine glycosylase family protein [Bacteroidota bacterium]